MELADKILEGSIELFMRYGVKSVSMDDIANRLGMSKKTIYTVFDNKKKLIKTAILNYVDKDEKEMKKILASSENALGEMISLGKHVYKFLRGMKPSLMYDLKKYHRETYAILEKQHFTFIREVIKNNIVRGITEKIYHKDIEAEIISMFYTEVSKKLVEEELFPDNNYRKEKIFVTHLVYHLRGLVNEEGKNLLEKELKKIKNHA